MTIDPWLLDILVCPETKQTLREAPAELLASVNASIERGEVRDRAGNAPATLHAGLVREDGKVLFPIRDGIPVLLPEHSISLPGEEAP